MSLEKLNPNPRFSLHLFKDGYFSNEPFVVVDVGASGGFEGRWRRYGEQVQLIGFEPNEAEFKKLSESASARIFQTALGRKKEKRKIFMPSWALSAGMYKPDMAYLSRFPNGGIMTPESEIEVETIDLDSFCEREDIESIDYIKLDTEGSELEILEGGKSILGDTTLAVEVEVAFVAYNEGRPLFADVDQYMRGLGFSVYDLALYRHARSGLPPIDKPFVYPSEYGQIFWGQALYMRDAVADLKAEGASGFDWTSTRIIKTIMLFEMHEQPDSAIELLEYGINEGLVPLTFRELADLMVPQLFGRPAKLDFYRNLYNALPQITKLR